LNWSSRVDAALQGAGLGLWAAGVIVLVWAARVLGGYMSQDGVTEDHEVVDSGPYRYVRHPVYGSFTAIAAGLGLVFRSYLLVGVAAVWLAASLWWAAAEEALLSSSEGLGETYRSYSERTGRFLPRLRQVPTVRKRCCVTPRERAVPSLRAGKDRDSWQVRSAVCDRVSDVDPRIEPTRDVGCAGRAGQTHG
jgi:hypothetical protein